MMCIWFVANVYWCVANVCLVGYLMSTQVSFLCNSHVFDVYHVLCCVLHACIVFGCCVSLCQSNMYWSVMCGERETKTKGLHLHECVCRCDHVCAWVCVCVCMCVHHAGAMISTISIWFSCKCSMLSALAQQHFFGRSQPSFHCLINWKWLQNDCWQPDSNSNVQVLVLNTAFFQNKTVKQK